MSIYGANIPSIDHDDGNDARSILDRLVQHRQESVLHRSGENPDRMGLCASADETTIVSKLHSELWSVLVPLSPLGAGYDATRKTVFHVSSSSALHGTTITHIRVNMGPDGGM